MEAYFLGLTQVGLMLSARDLDLACKWRDAGVPVETVCLGLRAAFDQFDTPPRSIWHCRRFIEVEVESWRVRAAGTHAEGAAPVSDARPPRRLRDPTRLPEDPQVPAADPMPGVWTRSLERLVHNGTEVSDARVKEAYRAAWRAMNALVDTPERIGIAMAIFEIEAEFFDAVFRALTEGEQHEVDSQMSAHLVSALKGMSRDARKAQLRVWRRPVLASLGAVPFFEP